MPTKVPLGKATVFPVVMYGCVREDGKESWVLKSWCFWTVVLEKTLESPLDCKEIQPVHTKGDQSWVFIGRTDVEAETRNTLATWREGLTHLKRPWCWERLRTGGEGNERGWAGWMASLTQWTRVWLNSRSWWRTGRPGLLQSMGLQRVGNDWATELNWTAPWEKSYGNSRQHVKRQRYYFHDNALYSQSSPSSSSHVWMWPVGTMKRAERQRAAVFQLQCWRRLLRVPWAARKSNQSILKEINPEYSLQGLLLKRQYLATWCKESTARRRPWCRESRRVREEDNRWDGWMVSQDSRDMSLSKREGIVKYREPRCTAVHGVPQGHRHGLVTEKQVHQRDPCLICHYPER